jgi:hypothetical protein
MKKLFASLVLAVALALTMVSGVLAAPTNVCLHLATAAEHAGDHPSDNSKVHECSITAE